MKKIYAVILALGLMLSLIPTVASANGGTLINSHVYSWTDPSSGGTINITENVYYIADDDMMWEYVVYNDDYDPIPGITNGLAGFQIVFDNPVPELYNQAAPAVGGPWDMNAYSGTWPPYGVEWDVDLPDYGIMPGETGVFSFHTYPREDYIQDEPDSWAHTWGLPIDEPIIDLDGTDTGGVGDPATDREVAVGDSLTGWPTGNDVEGIDWFDNDVSQTWSIGDGIHCEGPAYPGAIRDGWHDATDPVVVGTTAVGAPVSVDMESGLVNPGGAVNPGWAWDPRIKFHNANGSTKWDDGEDIVLDVNGDGVFGVVSNTQTNIFYGQHSVPGELWTEVYVDIKPMSCPNPLRITGKGVLPVAILGTEDFDVTTVDPASIRLVGLAGVPALRWAWEDVTTPYDGGEECGCNILEGDGFMDLTLKFETQEVIETLGEVNDGDVLTLKLYGTLHDGTHIIGGDCVIIRAEGVK